MKKLFLVLVSVLMLLGFSACSSKEELKTKTKINSSDETVSLIIKNKTKETVTELEGSVIFWDSKSDDANNIGYANFTFEGTLEPGKTVEIIFADTSLALATDNYEYETEAITCDFDSIKKVGYMVTTVTTVTVE